MVLWEPVSLGGAFIHHVICQVIDSLGSTFGLRRTGSEGNSTSCASLNCFSVVCNQISENLVFRCLTSFWKIAQFLSAFECLKGFYKKSWSSSDVQLSEERFTWFGFMFNKETNSPLTRSMHLQLLLFIKTKKIKKHFQYLKLVI